MKEFVEKLIERLSNTCDECIGWNHHKVNAYSNAIRIVKQLVEEYNPSKSSDLAEQIADDLSKVLKEAKSMGCREVKYFHHVPLENLEIVINALRAYNQDSTKKNQESKTRIEHIRTMSVEEMADAILERSEISTAIDFCQNFEQCYENVPEEKCRECLIKYLNSPVEQKKVIPTNYYMERFTEVV